MRPGDMYTTLDLVKLLRSLIPMQKEDLLLADAMELANELNPSTNN